MDAILKIRESDTLIYFPGSCSCLFCSVHSAGCDPGGWVQVPIWLLLFCRKQVMLAFVVCVALSVLAGNRVGCDGCELFDQS